MDAVDFVFETQSNDTLDVKVRANGFARLSDLECFVRFETMQSKTVFVRVKCYRPDLELMCAAKNTSRDLAAIGCENFSNGRHLSW